AIMKSIDIKPRRKVYIPATKKFNLSTSHISYNSPLTKTQNKPEKHSPKKYAKPGQKQATKDCSLLPT
ncbi:TPA: hypothetical protein ACRGDL_005350, partial [Klebsiella pneumoniae]